jgi:hypothetical protein
MGGRSLSVQLQRKTRWEATWVLKSREENKEVIIHMQRAGLTGKDAHLTRELRPFNNRGYSQSLT